MELRYYQRGAIDSIYRYFESETGNPLIVLPTGSGKSLVQAAFIKEACSTWSETRIVCLTHVRELLEQNSKALLRVWPEAPASYYSAGLNQKKVSQITFAGIQSAYALPALFSPADLVIIDEAHLVPKKTEGMYRSFLDGMLRHNPALKIIGLTATHYRLDSGLLTDGDDRLFTDVSYEANVGDLVKQGYLCPLVPRAGATKADLSGVRTRGGEFVPGDAERAMMADGLLDGALNEVIALGGERKSWLLFSPGVAHAEAAARRLVARGIAADVVHGETPSEKRRHVLNSLKDGRLRAVANVNCLTTGFDHPGIDLIAVFRPTKSTGLHVQMLGRGLRKAEGKTDTLVLDFAGNVQRHGPIDQIKIRKRGKNGEGEIVVAPIKECPNCRAFVHPAVMVCPTCGHVWPAKDPHGTEASDAPVLAATTPTKPYEVDRVSYSIHSKLGSPDSLRVDYLVHSLKQPRFSEWVLIEHEGYAGKKAIRWLWERGLPAAKSTAEAFEWALAGKIPAPVEIDVRPDGKWMRVTAARFARQEAVA